MNKNKSSSGDGPFPHTNIVPVYQSSDLTPLIEVKVTAFIDGTEINFCIKYPEWNCEQAFFVWSIVWNNICQEVVKIANNQAFVPHSGYLGLSN